MSVDLLLAALCAAGATALVLPRTGRPPRVSSLREAATPWRGSDIAAQAPWWGAVAALGLWLLVGGVLGALGGAVVGVVVARLVARAEPPGTRARREALTRDLPVVVDLVASALRAGAAPVSALGAVGRALDGPAGAELLALERRLDWGAEPLAVWQQLAAHPCWAPLGRALARATESGAPVADALLRLADDLRRRERAEVETRARAVGVRAAAPLGLCLLPAFVLVGVVPLMVAAVQSLELGAG